MHSIELDAAPAERLSTALHQFCRELPAVYRGPHEGAPVRQLLAFGAWQAEGAALTLRPGAWLCIETGGRRVHAFVQEGGPTLLRETELATLALLADASCRASSPTSTTLEFHLGRAGWKVLDSAQDLQELFAEEASSPSGTPTTAHLKGRESNLFAAEPAEPSGALADFFAAEFPELEGPELRPDIVRALHHAARPLLDAFLSGLQPLAIEACKSLHCCGIGSYNVLAHRRPHMALYRSQAVQAIPALGRLLVQAVEAWTLPIWLAIDARRSLVKAAAQALGVRREILRFLSGITVAELGMDDPSVEELWRGTPQFLMTCLGAIRPEHRPSAWEEWDAFHRIVRPLRQLQPEFMPVIATFLHGASRLGLPALAGRLSRRLGHPDAIADIDEHLDCLAGELRRRRRLAPGERQEFRKSYVARRGLFKVALDAHRWRTMVAREVARRLAALEHSSARPRLSLPIPVPEEIDGLRFVFLGSGADLVAESLQMSHCVESLYPALVQGKRLPFSVRDAGGFRNATFDLSLHHGEDEWCVELNELKGPRNRDVEPPIATAVRAFVKAVRKTLNENGSSAEHWLAECRSRRVPALERDRARITRAAERAAIRPFVERLLGDRLARS